MNNGNEIPLVGLGTYSFIDKDALKKALIEHKYRLIDTASYYKNEEPIGQGLKELFESGELKREDIFVVTKIWIDEVEDVEGACRASLKRL